MTSRLTIRGFQDLTVENDVYASTATRWGQRLIASLAVQKGWKIWVADVATAFLQSMTFEQIAAINNTEAREVSFIPPVGSEPYWREVKGLEKFTVMQHVLRLLKPAYGLKDAPRAWKNQLERVLRLAGGMPLHTEKCLWVWFKDSRLVLILSTRVDDLKGCGEDDVVKKVLSILTKEFGTLKYSENEFEHCGIKYSTDLTTGTITLNQDHYAKQLMLIDHAVLTSMKSTDPLTDVLSAQYLSLLGGLSWLNQTRSDVAVYTCALQRAAKAPLVEHALRLNRVVKWSKRKSVSLVYKYMRGKIRVQIISDAAFRKEDVKGLAMRGAMIGLCEWSSTTPGGTLHLLEFYARKQRRVTRSTFSAELNAASDAYEVGKLLAMTVSETMRPFPNIASLIKLDEQGTFEVGIEMCIDARSVFDALKANETKSPSEVSLIMVLCALKEALLSHSLACLWWIDTRDMLADGLNKGACSRAKLLEFGQSGVWKLDFPAIGHSESRHVGIESQKEMLQAITEPDMSYWVQFFQS